MAKQTTKGGKSAPTTKFERGSTMPPPTGDTQEPRLSKRLGKPAKGRK